jgi:D-sedoheptulose 7-phosphate isomerase
MTVTASERHRRTGELFARRRGPAEILAAESETIARACHDMAVRFHRGGKLVVFGAGGTTTDAQHVSVEFVHPVIVGKRALPAISLTNDVGTVTGIAEREGFDEIFAYQLGILGRPDDIALGISSHGDSRAVRRGLEEAARLGMLTIALAGGDGRTPAAGGLEIDHIVVVPSDDPRVVKEVHVTAYHILWELVHVFFEQPGILSPKVLS